MLVVLGSGAAFGVVLNAERGQVAVAEAFHRQVVQVALGDVEIARGYRGGVDLELMVLAGDVDPPGVQVFDRVIGTMVSIGQPRGRGAGGPAEDLMAETDAEQRNAAQRLARELNGAVEDGGIARAVRQHQAVRLQRPDVRPCRGVRKHDHRATALAERAEDVGFHPIVDDGDQQAFAVTPPPSPQLGRQRFQPLFLCRPRGLRHQVLVGQRPYLSRRRRQVCQA